jgi:hypothetical protein
LDNQLICPRPQEAAANHGAIDRRQRLVERSTTTIVRLLKFLD